MTTTIKQGRRKKGRGPNGQWGMGEREEEGIRIMKKKEESEREGKRMSATSLEAGWRTNGRNKTFINFSLASR